MWIPISIKINNFRSIIDETLNFQNGKTFLLQGLNKTDEGFESNGSGKSSFREALSYCLGLPVYAERTTDLINDYSDSMTVEFVCKNNLNDKELKVIRSTPVKGSTALKIELNGKDQSDNFATVNEGDKLIVDVIGLAKDDILNHFLISKEKFVSFFSSSDREKKELINRFSGADKVSGVDVLISNDIAKEESKLKQLELSISSINGKIEILEEDLEAEMSIDFLSEKNTVLVRLRENLSDYQDKVKSLETNLNDLKKQVIVSKDKLKAESEKVNVFDLDIEKSEKRILKLRERKNQVEEEISEYKSFINELKTILKGVLECPKCHFEFNPTENVDVEEAKNQLPEIDKAVISLENTVKEIVSDIAEQKETLNSFQSKKREQQKIIDKIDQEIRFTEREIQSNSREITNTDNLIESVEKEIQKTIESEVKSKEGEIKEKIESLKENRTEVEKQLSELKLKVDDLNQWKIRFKKFQSYLANQSLTSIQGFTNLYLRQMKTNLSVRIEGFKQNKDGSIREKITPTILRNGMIEGTGSYKKYSGGERCRIDIAIALSMRHIINSTSKSGGMDLFWIDEITEGTDGIGIEAIAESVNELAITSIITSHVKHEKNFTNILTAIKENGETTLKIN